MGPHSGYFKFYRDWARDPGRDYCHLLWETRNFFKFALVTLNKSNNKPIYIVTKYVIICRKSLKKSKIYMDFTSLHLDPRILRAIEEAGFTTPTPIQKTAIPEIRNGIDLRCSAQTGTGKTVAFLLPALQLLCTPSPKKGIGPRILILVPTRELAMQVAEEAKKYAKYLPKTKTVCIYGGAPYPPQKRDLERPYEILVATPGRLIDHMDLGRIDMSKVEMLVLDEADRMLDMGFLGPVEQIAGKTPKNRQTLLFSATLQGQVLQLSKRLMNEPKEISVIPEKEKYDHIKQEVYYVDHLRHKLDVLKHLLNDASINQAVIFTSTKRYADELAKELRDAGHTASALHGDMNQRQRARTLANLRRGSVTLLVATDVAARGIDVPTITHVFNFDLPHNPEDYTHRIGRTGRAGAKGVALSFATYKDRSLMKDIENYTKNKLIPQVIEGLEPKSKPQDNTERPSSSKRRRPFSYRGKPRSHSGSRR